MVDDKTKKDKTSFRRGKREIIATFFSTFSPHLQTPSFFTVLASTKFGFFDCTEIPGTAKHGKVGEIKYRNIFPKRISN